MLAAIGILAADVAFRRRMPAAWDIVSWLTAIGLIATVVVGFVSVEGDLPFYLQVLVAGVLVPDLDDLAWRLVAGQS